MEEKFKKWSEIMIGYKDMRRKISLFRESLKLVWESSPGWATANIFALSYQEFSSIGANMAV